MGIRGGQPSFETAASAKQLTAPLLTLPRHTPTCDLYVAFNTPYLHDFITKLCRSQAAVTLNHDNVHVRNIGQGEAQHRKYKGFKFDGCQTYDRSSIYKQGSYPWTVYEHYI
jgi:hypothetical protein